jgi:hypothetical protein
MRIGVIADTHGHFEARLPELFSGVDHILHGGDIGLPWVILELQQIAPVTAVSGNTDVGLRYRETETVQLGERRFLVHHIVEPHRLETSLARRLGRERPDVVVFGHTHRRFCETIGSTLFLNPGYAGKPRFGLPRSVAILDSGAAGINVHYCEL